MRMQILKNATWECELEDQTVEHLIWYCPLVNQGRIQLIAFLESKKVRFGKDVCKIFNTASREIVMRILAFILANKIEL